VDEETRDRRSKLKVPKLDRVRCPHCIVDQIEGHNHLSWSRDAILSKGRDPAQFGFNLFEEEKHFRFDEDGLFAILREEWIRAIEEDGHEDHSHVELGDPVG
jgi:hypothetical protein